MEKVTVHYQGGQSRYSNSAVDYMLALVDDVELYAESLEIDTSYDNLKEDILTQAKENNIDSSRLKFWHD